MDEFLRIAVITLHGMWNHRWIGIATAWLAAAVSFLAIASTPELYEASARIFVNTDSILKPLMTGLTVQPNDDQRIVMLSRVVISRPNVERLVQSVGLDANLPSREQREAVVDSVIKRLQFKGAGRDNVYTLTFRDVDPERARKAVEMMTGMFIQSSKGGKSEDTETAKKFIEEQIAVYDKKLQDAENRLKEFRTRYLGMAPGEGRQDYFARMAETERTLNQARLELREAERARDAYRRGLESADAPVPGSPTPVTGALAADLDSRIETQRRNLDALLQRYTDNHPDVQGARRVLRDIEAQRAQLGPVRSAAAAPAASAFAGPRASEQLKISLAQSEASVASLSARVAEYAARYDNLKQSASLVPKLEAELAQLNRDYEVNKRNYEMLAARRESANISGEMQTVSGVADFRMVDPPRVSPQPVWPTHRVLFPLALLASLAAGLIAAYVARELRPSFYDGRSLRESTGLPLLGVVSLNVTAPASRRMRQARIRFAGALGALVASYAVGFVALEVVLKQLR